MGSLRGKPVATSTHDQDPSVPIFSVMTGKETRPYWSSLRCRISTFAPIRNSDLRVLTILRTTAVTGIAKSDGKRPGTFVGGSDDVQTFSEDVSLLFNKNVVCTYYTAFSVSTSHGSVWAI